jgi:predicted amidohydrolase YtcJ
VWARNAGPERTSRAWCWQAVAKSGGRLAFGSDWPVVTLNPWHGVYNALNRQTQDGHPPGGWLPDQRLSLEQTIEGYTLGAAFAGHREKTEGSIEAGKLADLVILDRDLFKTPASESYRTEVQLTMVGGKVVYRAPARPPAPR